MENYTLAGGNDSEGRDPKSWILSGSNDGNTYYVLDEVTDASLPIEYCAYYPEDYAVDSPRFYSYYKIEFTEYRGEEGYFQLSELVLSGQAEAPQPVTLPDALVHYDFANGVADVSGNSNDGTVSEEGVTISDGMAAFDGGNVAVPIETVAQTKTISMLVRADEVRSWSTIFEAGQDGQGFMKIALQSNDLDRNGISITFGGTEEGNNPQVRVMAETTMDIQEWTELTFVEENENVTIYINGQQAATSTFLKETWDGTDLNGLGFDTVTTGNAAIGISAVWPIPASRAPWPTSACTARP